MTGILQQLRTVTEKINQLKIGWALIGGLAVSVHGTPRTTKDIDIAVVVDTPLEQEHLADRLSKLGFVDKQLLMHAAPTQKLGFRFSIPGSSHSPLPLDLLFSSSGIEREVVESAELVEVFPALFIPIATRAHLLAMKVVSENDSDRLQDRLDIQGLLIDADSSDIAGAREALDLITERNFNRGKDLQLRFNELLQKFNYS